MSSDSDSRTFQLMQDCIQGLNRLEMLEKHYEAAGRKDPRTIEGIKPELEGLESLRAQIEKSREHLKWLRR